MRVDCLVVEIAMIKSAQVFVDLVAAFALDLLDCSSNWEVMSSLAQGASSGSPSHHTSWPELADSVMASGLEFIAATWTIVVVRRLQPQLAISFRPCSERQATDENSASSGAGSIGSPALAFTSYRLQ